MEEQKQEKGFVVDGYLFATEEEAQEARKELQGILYLQKNNNLRDAKVMLQIYQKLLEQGLFRTPIGLNYLKYLQNNIRNSNLVDSVPPIPVFRGKREEISSLNESKTMMELNDVGGMYRRRFRIAIFVIIILLAGMAAMIGIAATTNQPNILNYEQEIIDKYEQWEQELEMREKNLKE